MDIKHRVQSAVELTPADQAIADTIFVLKDGIADLTMPDLAKASNTSTAAISRFCKKIGFRGYRDLKMEAVQSYATSSVESVDANYPFEENDTPRSIGENLKQLYSETLCDTFASLDFPALQNASRLICKSKRIYLFTHSHNFYAAETFRERLLRIGISTFAAPAEEEQRILASMADREDLTIVISYSGRATFLPKTLNILRRRGTPCIFVGTAEGARLHQGLAGYLLVSGNENAHTRLSQFASHVSLQYLLDVLYGCVFTIGYQQNLQFLYDNNPYIDDRIFPTD